MSEPLTLIASEGWIVLHLFYRADHSNWSMLSREEQISAKTKLTELVAEIRATDNTHLLTFSMVSPKADIGFMLLCSDLAKAQSFEKRLTLALGPDVLNPVFSYLSMTERSEYTTSEEEYLTQLTTEGVTDTAEREKKLGEWRVRMADYLKHRLNPVLPAWPMMCFYPMMKRRGSTQNWYALPFERRKELMMGHARVGRQWHGKILQLITGSTGLDEWEWAVTLLAKDIGDIKGIVYQMRFDEVSVQYAEFGDFYIGLQVAMDELFRRSML